jgi:hypothetical protein
MRFAHEHGKLTAVTGVMNGRRGFSVDRAVSFVRDMINSVPTFTAETRESFSARQVTIID